MKKFLIVMGAFAVALMITLSSYAACPYCTENPCCKAHAQCCKAHTPCCKTHAPCYKRHKCKIINKDKAREKSSFDVITNSQKLNIFERIVKQACMEDYLECGNYIALVPKNRALKDVKFQCPDEAKKFVLNHLIDAKCYPCRLCEYKTIKTLCGKEYNVSVECHKMKINCVNVLCIAKTKNGLIVVLDDKLD